MSGGAHGRMGWANAIERGRRKSGAIPWGMG
jgi:hypothetical protein